MGALVKSLLMLVLSLREHFLMREEIGGGSSIGLGRPAKSAWMNEGRCGTGAGEEVRRRPSGPKPPAKRTYADPSARQARVSAATPSFTWANELAARLGARWPPLDLDEWIFLLEGLTHLDVDGL
jgi:hypothetical protein